MGGEVRAASGRACFVGVPRRAWSRNHDVVSFRFLRTSVCCFIKMTARDRGTGSRVSGCRQRPGAGSGGWDWTDRHGAGKGRAVWASGRRGAQRAPGSAGLMAGEAAGKPAVLARARGRGHPRPGGPWGRPEGLRVGDRHAEFGEPIRHPRGRTDGSAVHGRTPRGGGFEVAARRATCEVST